MDVCDFRKMFFLYWNIVPQQFDSSRHAVVNVAEVKEILIVILIKINLHGEVAVGSPFGWRKDSTRLENEHKISR